jgi:hypothetical protein
MGTGPTSSAAPQSTQIEVVAGVRNLTPPTPADTQACALQVDAVGNLLVNVAASGGGSSATQVEGTTAADTAAVGFPVLVAGTDNAGVVQELPVADAGTTTPERTVIVGGSDGTNVRARATDTSGREIVVGAAAADAAVSGNPVLVAGVDNAGNVQELPVADSATAAPSQVLVVGGVEPGGSTVRSIQTDVTGRLANVYLQTGADAIANTNLASPVTTVSGAVTTLLTIGNFLFNGTTWDRQRSGGATGAAMVAGAAAADAAASGNPVLIGGVDAAGNVQELPVADAGTAVPAPVLVIGGKNNSGNVLPLQLDFTGNIPIASAAGAFGDGNSNTQIFPSNLNSSQIFNVNYPFLFNGTTWDRQRSAGIGDAVASTGIAASAAYSEYTSTAPAPTTGQYSALQSDHAGALFVKPIRRSETVSQATTIASSGAATTVLAAQAAGIFADISALIITVTPLAGAVADTAFTATLSDGTNTYIYDLDTGATGSTTVSGVPSLGLNAQFNPPLPATTAATAWTIQLSSAAVTVHITVVAVRQKAS